MWVTMWATMWTPLPAVASLALLAVVAAHAAPTSAIVGGLETSLLDGRLPGQDHPQQQPPPQGRPTTARLERVYSSSLGSIKQSSKAKAGQAGPRTRVESFSRTGNRVHLTPAGTPSENPAPCAVGGRHFLHGQQVTRSDACEFCLCLDGEVFCWWQECPPSTAEGPCRGRPAFSSCQDDVVTAAPAAAAGVGTSAETAATSDQQASGEVDADASQNDTTSPTSTLPPSATSPTKGQQTTGVLQDSTNNPQGAAPGSGVADESSARPSVRPSGTVAASPATGLDDNLGGSNVTATVASAANPTNATTTSVPTTTELMCHVLGSSYRVGEVLPRDTGSCLQCECSPAGRVTCSPKDCLSVREEEDVYQPASSLDMFDVDSF